MLDTAARRAAVVLVLDDLQWAAIPTLLLVRHLFGRPSPASLLLVGTYRSSEVTPALADTLADLHRGPAVERLELTGLDGTGVASLVQAVTGESTASGQGAALASAIHASTAGNPFFVGELLRYFAESGAVLRRSEGWTYYADPEGVDIPQAVREVVARRVARLSAPSRTALVMASVFGAEFDLDLLERALTDPDAALDALEECVRARLLSSFRFHGDATSSSTLSSAAPCTGG